MPIHTSGLAHADEACKTWLLEAAWGQGLTATGFTRATLRHRMEPSSARPMEGLGSPRFESAVSCWLRLDIEE